MGSVMTIGIAGGTGSGKTTITRRLLQKFSSNVSVIYHDNYYKAHNDLNYEQRSLLNYDCPDAFDTELMLRDLKRLRAGEAIRCPVYDYTIHNRSEKTVLVKPSPVVIVEGILILQDPRLCELLDIKIFVDTDADVRILRRIVRDVRDRGRSLESVVDQYLTTVKPMHEMYVEPSKRNADIIIPEGGHNLVAMDMLIADEAQFFTPGQIDELRDIVDELGVPVLCFGLRTDFLTHMFPGSMRLMELADSITEIKTVCACGSKATVNARVTPDGRIVTEGEQVFLGGNDAYVAMCHRCWKKKIS